MWNDDATVVTYYRPLKQSAVLDVRQFIDEETLSRCQWLVASLCPMVVSAMGSTRRSWGPSYVGERRSPQRADCVRRADFEQTCTDRMRACLRDRFVADGHGYSLTELMIYPRVYRILQGRRHAEARETQPS